MSAGPHDIVSSVPVPIMIEPVEPDVFVAVEPIYNSVFPKQYVHKQCVVDPSGASIVEPISVIEIAGAVAPIPELPRPSWGQSNEIKQKTVAPPLETKWVFNGLKTERIVKPILKK